MRILITTAFLSFGAIVCSAQKAKIKNVPVKTENAQMPKHYITSDQRSYVVEVNAFDEVDPEYVYDNIDIKGWEQKDENAAAKVLLNFGVLKQGEPTKESREDVKKDKEGKITSRTRYYWYEAKHVGKGIAKVYGPTNKFKPTKYELKQEAKKEEAEAKTEANPFLQDVEVEDNGSGDIAGTFDISRVYVYKTKEHKSSVTARDAYYQNRGAAFNNYQSGYIDDIIDAANRKLNEFYGYLPVKNTVRLKTIKNDNHPEHTKYNQAIEAVKAIFQKRTYETPISEVRSEMQPIVDYFESINSGIKAGDKEGAKLKEANLENLADIYYFLDQPDKLSGLIRQFEAIKAKASVKQYTKKAEGLKEIFDFFKVDGRYVQ